MLWCPPSLATALTPGLSHLLILSSFPSSEHSIPTILHSWHLLLHREKQGNTSVYLRASYKCRKKLLDLKIAQDKLQSNVTPRTGCDRSKASIQPGSLWLQKKLSTLLHSLICNIPQCFSQLQGYHESQIFISYCLWKASEDNVRAEISITEVALSKHISTSANIV